jgi:2,3-bisphosphoglycerate-independent phosphoglycerate mutase
MKNTNKLLLVILDGFGLNYDSDQNPILTAQTPTFDNIIRNYPFTVLRAGGEEVGLSWGEVGNSEVGHFNLGSGQILWQNLPKIDQTIKSGQFFKNKVLRETCQAVGKAQSSLHLIGLVSDGGIHSHIRHLLALLKLAQNQRLKKVFIHVISDGRDTPPKSVLKYINQLEAETDKLGIGQISTISGRQFAMDRNNNWQRTEAFYNALIGQSESRFDGVPELLDFWYKEGADDENITPSAINLNTEAQFLRDNDGVIIFNFRADRARQMTKAINDPNLTGFSRQYLPQNLALTTMTPYEEDWKMEIRTVFQPPRVDYPASLLISDQNLTQYHTAESEKKAHVTYFFNGGNDQFYPQEKDKIFPSPNVKSYDLKPEMNLPAVVENLVKIIDSDNYNFILVNFANPDMVGHTGNFEAVKKAIEVVDRELAKLLTAASATQYTSLITADHGNAEQMLHPATGQPDKEHTINPVPFFWVDRYQSTKKKFDSQALWKEVSQLPPAGILTDVTATLLNQLEVPIPQSIIGEDLSDALVKLP